MKIRRRTHRSFMTLPLLVAAVGACALVLATFDHGLAANKKKPPKFVNPVLEEPGPTAKVYVDASKITYNSKTGVAEAFGKVILKYGKYVLTATHVTYNEKTGRFTANGSVVLKEPNGNVLEADSTEMWQKFKEGFANHVKALLTNDVTITAHYARMHANGITVYTKAMYTACKGCTGKNGHPLWELDAATAKHNKNNKTIYYDDMVFRIGGVPVFYLPYFAYPDPTVKRRTGFVWPNLKYGSVYGGGLVVPYFLNLAPNYDLTFSPMITTKQGVLADIEWRHKLKSGSYNIRGYGIYELDPEQSKPDSRWRGALTTKGDFNINRNWSWGWDVIAASDSHFLKDYSIDGSDIAANRAYLQGIENRNYYSAELHNYLPLSTSIESEKLPWAVPQIQTSNTLDRPILGGELGFDTESYALFRQSPVKSLDLGTEQVRQVSNLHWQRQMITAAGVVLKPFAKVQTELTFAKDVPNSPSTTHSQAEILPAAGLDLRWPLIASSATGSSVISPVFQAIAAPDAPKTGGYGLENAKSFNLDHTNLFLSDRVTGTDRYEGGSRINAGLTYSYLANNGWSARASAGESFKIAGDNGYVSGSGLDGPVSDLVGSFDLQPWNHLKLSYEVRAEEDLSQVNSQEAFASLTFDRISGSLGYADIAAAPNYARPNDEEQVWGSASLKLGEAWRLFGGLRYDLLSDEFVQKTVGLSFDCDCMNAKLTYSERLRAGASHPIEHSLMFSVSFRTLGGSSASFSF